MILWPRTGRLGNYAGQFGTRQDNEDLEPETQFSKKRGD